MGGEGEFLVTERKREVVKAMLPVQQNWLPLSNLDLLLPPVDVSVFLCYEKLHGSSSNGGDNFTFDSMVNVLKRGMAQALVSYYPFSGELVRRTGGETELLCNDRGVDFIEAFADVQLQHLNLYDLDESIEGKLVPQKKNGVLCVQATELKCGGLVLACTFDHRIADAYSADMFLLAWAKMAQSKPPSVQLPSFRRSLLNARSLGFCDTSLDHMYVPISALPPPEPPQAGACPFMNRLFYVKAEQLHQLQSLASTSSQKRTKLESLSAFLWKIVATTHEITQTEEKKICRLGMVVDGRTRLCRGDGEMSTYFGNVLSIPFGEKSTSDLREKPLSWVANAVHEFLEGAMTKEHFLGLVDWVEAHGREPALGKVFCGGSSPGPAFVVSSGKQFPAPKLDFGWGRPALGSYRVPKGGADVGYVMTMPSPANDGDWVVYMQLLEGQIGFIESHAAHVFRPVTYDYLHFTHIN